jgi:hypothetical protein
MNEREIDLEQVRSERLAEVNAAAHWAYLFVVLIVGAGTMVALIAFLGG